MKTLNLVECNALMDIVCSYNDLTTLDVSALPKRGIH